MKGFSEQVRQASLQNNAGIVYPAWGKETALDDLLRFLLSLLVYVHVCDSFFLNMRSNSISRFSISYLLYNRSHWILRLSESSVGGTIIFWAVYSRWLQALSLLSVGCILELPPACIITFTMVSFTLLLEKLGGEFWYIFSSGWLLFVLKCRYLKTSGHSMQTWQAEGEWKPELK